VIIAMALTRDGMPVRSWVLPGDTADVSTVAKIKADLHAWRLGRCLFVGDAGMYTADNLAAMSKVAAAAKCDGKFVVITNDETLAAEDVALGCKGGWTIESCFRRIKQTGLEVRPMYHWTPRRIEAHVKLCVLALQMRRAAEIACGLPWAQIAHALSALKAVRYQAEGRGIVQRTKIGPEVSEILRKLRISTPKRLLSLGEPAETKAVA